MKDTVKEKLVEIINDLELGIKNETLKPKLLKVIDEYEVFRKVAEYMSEMVESLQKRITEEEKIKEDKHVA